MPLLCGVLGFRALAVLFDVGDGEDIRVAVWGVAAKQTGFGKWTEAAGKRKVLVMVHNLPPKEQDPTLPQQLPQGGDGGVSQLIAGAQVQTKDFRAGAPRQWTHLVRQI